MVGGGHKMSLLPFQLDITLPPCPKCRCTEVRKELAVTERAVFPDGTTKCGHIEKGTVLFVRCRECGYQHGMMRCADQEREPVSAPVPRKHDWTEPVEDPTCLDAHVIRCRSCGLIVRLENGNVVHQYAIDCPGKWPDKEEGK